VIEVRLPQFGMGMRDAMILKWLYSPGDTVKEGEPLVEIEAAKATVEVVAPASGVLTTILVKENEVVQVRDLIAIISAGE